MKNVLGLFDGISCGQIALERAGITYDTYYASEIEEQSIAITQHHFPKTVQLGDITKWREWNLPSLDLIIGGSPCQGFSSAGKRLNFDDPRSRLFFEFVAIIKHYKPTYWLLENVVMQPHIRDAISATLGVEPVFINSNLVSAQNRKRYYWTNIPNVSEPADANISLASILEDSEYTNGAGICGRRLNEHGHRNDYDKSLPIVQCLQVARHDKAPCLTTVSKDSVVSKRASGRYPHAYESPVLDDWRDLTLLECERLQTLPDGYTDVAGVPPSKRRRIIGNGWTVDVIAHIMRHI